MVFLGSNHLVIIVLVQLIGAFCSDKTSKQRYELQLKDKNNEHFPVTIGYIFIKKQDSNK